MKYRGDGIGELYKIGELAEVSQVSKRTIDYYTKMGLLICERSESNYRFYQKDAVDDLVFIDECKKMNMPLEEIKQRLTMAKAEKADSDALTHHAEYISRIMQHLQTELKELCSSAEKLDKKEQEKIIHSLIPKAAGLNEKLTLLLDKGFSK